MFDGKASTPDPIRPGKPEYHFAPAGSHALSRLSYVSIERSFRRMILSRLFSIALLLAFALLARPATAETVYPVGSQIGLTPPAGMTVSEAFPGFEDRERKAAILIAQLPGPAYEQFLKAMSAGAINIPGVSNAKREILLTEGGAAHLVVGDQETEGVKLKKWLMITRRTVASHDSDVALAFVITAQVPEEASDAYPDAEIRKALGSVALRPGVPPEEILDQMPFKVTDLAKFEGVRSLLPGRALMLTERPAHVDVAPTDPVLMISIGGGAPSQPDQRATFSQEILRNIQGYKNLKLVFAEAMRIGGQPGYEVRLEGQSADTDREVTIVQWTRFSAGGFIRVVGVSPREQWLDNFPRFRAVRDGIDTR